MEQLFSFLINHYILSASFIGLWVLFFWLDSKRSGQKVTVHEMIQSINQYNAVVLDIRDEADFKSGHIVDAVNIPYAMVSDKISELNKFKSQPIIVVCKMGQHSASIGKQLQAAGFEQVSRLAGGIVTWQNENLPLIKQ